MLTHFTDTDETPLKSLLKIAVWQLRATNTAFVKVTHQAVAI